MTAVEKGLPLLRVKRPAGNATLDTVHVRLRKRRRLSQNFNALSISPSTPLSASQLSPQPSSNRQKRTRASVVQDDNNNDNDIDSTVVIFRRVDTIMEASTATTTELDENTCKIVDIDTSFLNVTNNEKWNENQTETKTDKDKDDDYVMFAATATAPDTDGQENEDGNNNEVVAYVDAENIEKLRELLDQALTETSDDNDDIDDSDYDARTVDYPSTPDQLSDDDGYHFEEEENGHFEEDEDEDEDEDDNVRYVRHDESVDYDKEC